MGVNGAPYEGDVHAHISVVAGALKTDVYAKSDTRPCRVPCLAIETHLHLVQNLGPNVVQSNAYLVRLLRFQDLEDLFCLRFCWVCHCFRDRAEGGIVVIGLKGRWWRQPYACVSGHGSHQTRRTLPVTYVTS
jgi:hypothetical protein